MSRLLTPLEDRYLLVEVLIDECNLRVRHLSGYSGIHRNYDLFADPELVEWCGIRAACLDEAERIERLYQEVPHG